VTTFIKRFGFAMLASLMLLENSCQMDSPRGALMYNAYFALLNYAKDHDGLFPASDKGPYEALQKLYPYYCSSGRELAGLSGDIDSVVNCLKQGNSLTDKLSSWVYVQGLKDTDDPDLAILWEARSGLFSNGRRDPSGGHAVAFIGGDIRQISGSDWTNFLAQQEQMRKTALDKRLGQTHASPK
jgi:hypothetical protein